MAVQDDGTGTVGAGEATVPMPVSPPAPPPAAVPAPDIDAARLRGMVAGLNAIVWERDPVTWAIRFVNDRIEEVLGYPAARWRADPDLWFEVLHPDDREPTVAAVQRALAGSRTSPSPTGCAPPTTGWCGCATSGTSRATPRGRRPPGMR